LGSPGYGRVPFKSKHPWPGAQADPMRLPEEKFAELVREALDSIPEELSGFLDEVTVDIAPYPDERICREAGVEVPHELLGYYQGTPLTERSFEQNARLPDRITIFQRNIERICRSRREIVAEVRKTVLHEVGHHFGLDEDELEELGFD